MIIQCALHHRSLFHDFHLNFWHVFIDYMLYCCWRCFYFQFEIYFNLFYYYLCFRFSKIYISRFVLIFFPLSVFQFCFVLICIYSFIMKVVQKYVMITFFLFDQIVFCPCVYIPLYGTLNVTVFASYPVHWYWMCTSWHCVSFQSD